jgi:hypothetical protein
MSTDYILFVHGVNTRAKDEMLKPGYSNWLFDKIKDALATRTDLNLKQIEVYWGDIPKEELDKLRQQFDKSSVWSKFWFQDFRKQQIIDFAGDAALYLSRHAGSLVADQILRDATEIIQILKPNDRLHLVTHSWGTIILFDILFANRWTVPDNPGFTTVNQIREAVFGLPPNQSAGIWLSSLITMGSPLALFSLVHLIGSPEGVRQFDLLPNLQELLATLKQNSQKKIPWLNFTHPGDPIAYPLETVIPQLIDTTGDNIEIKDILTSGSGLLDLVAQPLGNSFLSLVNGGNAHSSYWENQKVAEQIAAVIQQSAVIQPAEIR